MDVANWQQRAEVQTGAKRKSVPHVYLYTSRVRIVIHANKSAHVYSTYVGSSGDHCSQYALATKLPSIPGLVADLLHKRAAVLLAAESVITLVQSDVEPSQRAFITRTRMVGKPKWTAGRRRQVSERRHDFKCLCVCRGHVKRKCMDISVLKTSTSTAVIDVMYFTTAYVVKK